MFNVDIIRFDVIGTITIFFRKVFANYAGMNPRDLDTGPGPGRPVSSDLIRGDAHVPRVRAAGRASE